jgi:hypothetical protein
VHRAPRRRVERGSNETAHRTPLTPAPATGPSRSSLRRIRRPVEWRGRRTERTASRRGRARRHRTAVVGTGVDPVTSRFSVRHGGIRG